MIPAYNLRATLRRETNTGHAADGSPTKNQVFVWTNMPCFLDENKVDFEQGSTSARMETEFTIKLPWLVGDRLPRVSDVIIIDNIEHRVHEVRTAPIFSHHVTVTAYRVTRRGI
jgi:hypothetical protein